MKIKAYPTVETRRRRVDLYGAARPCSRRRPTTNGCARRQPTVMSARPTKNAITCKRSKAVSTPRIPRSRTTISIGDINEPRNRDGAPQLDVEHTDYGYYYVSTRDLGEGNHYVRVYHYVMPFQQLRGGIHQFDGSRRKLPELDGHIWVPIDDEQTYVYNWSCGYDEEARFEQRNHDEREAFYGRGPDDLIPGTFRLKKNKSNDYMIDRQLQKTKTFTGIVGVNTQDFALQEGMGPIVDRSREHLGTSDRAIVTMRRLLLEAVGRRRQRTKSRAASIRRATATSALMTTSYRAERTGRASLHPKLVAKW